ncbi:transmembrane channel-like protein 5 [Eupeodes corollae]|uniref:transmembrane channel-like protein 5 n=1 Tax=Eupeodes corollae TaxID=290404 RepID=UPI00249277FF|nr:transmembrane channel-like protein 5 [Eupeodes corollae]
MRRQGVDNSLFAINNDDTDRIDVVTEASSHSDLNSTGSHHFLTGSKTNYQFTNPDNEDEAVRIQSPANRVRRWSQNISKIGKSKSTVRDKTIYKLPSRKVFAVDGKLLPLDCNAEIEQLVEEIEQHDYLMQNSAVGKQIRIETIRALPHPLSTKRQLKSKISLSVTKHLGSEKAHIMRRLSDILAHCCLKLWAILGNLFSGIEIWYDAMKTIEGHFGCSVGTYFKFLRWLFIMNVVVLALTFSFITLPQILFNIFDERSRHFADKIVERKFVDLLNGEGFLKNSILFYGAYTNMTITLNTSSSYSLPHAYYVTMLLIYLVTFVLISSSMARSYRKSFIESSGGIPSMYAHKIFCSWDFGISNSKAASIKHESIYNELKSVVSDIGRVKKNIPRLWKLWIFCARIAAHLLVVALIAGLGIAIWILLKFYGEAKTKSPWKSLYVATAVNVSMLVLQAFFSWIGKMEDYRTPRRTLHVTLIRTFLLEAVIIGVLVFFWLTKEYQGCWETAVGQEIYRLVVSDFLINIFIVPLLDVFRANVLARRWPKIEKPNFDISQNSLGLVFNQTLLWVGLLFSPLLALVLVVKMALTFYVKKTTLIYLCKSPKHMWRSAQTQTLYLVFTFLSLLGVILTLGYIMTQVPVSRKCGPFRDYVFMFQIFINGVLKLQQNDWVWGALMTLIRPAVVGGILLAMMVMVYYLRSKSKARGKMVKLLKDMLYIEAKDKEFLVMHITRITKNRHWMFEEDDRNSKLEDDPSDEFAESCSTWKYERHKPRNRSTSSRSSVSSL